MTNLICGLTILAAGCEFTTSEGELNPITPSQVTITPVLLSTWSNNAAAASGTGLPSAASCTELEFTFTEQNGAMASGTFRASCAGGIELTGTATGTYTDELLTVMASGTASALGTQCPFTLSGTARVTTSQIEIEYTGTSCLGPVSGSEVLNRN
jgi:hypothetical protein